jgi:hypothetical protein
VRDRVEAGVLSVAGVLYAWAVVLLVTGNREHSPFLSELGPIELGTALALLAGAAYSVARAVRMRARIGRRALVTGFVMAAGLLFGAGEELSWGQVLLGFETPGFIAEHNMQNQVTVHNLAFGWFELNFFLFGPPLTAAMLGYAFGAGRAWRLRPAFRRLAARWDLPVPRRRHAVLMLAVVALELGLGALELLGAGKVSSQEHSEFATCWLLFCVLVNRMNEGADPGASAEAGLDARAAVGLDARAARAHAA